MTKVMIVSGNKKCLLISDDYRWERLVVKTRVTFSENPQANQAIHPSGVDKLVVIKSNNNNTFVCAIMPKIHRRCLNSVDEATVLLNDCKYICHVVVRLTECGLRSMQLYVVCKVDLSILRR